MQRGVVIESLGSKRPWLGQDPKGEQSRDCLRRCQLVTALQGHLISFLSDLVPSLISLKGQSFEQPETGKIEYLLLQLGFHSGGWNSPPTCLDVLLK